MNYPYGYQPAYSYNPVNTYIPQQNSCGMSCRPVSSAEEARSIQVQFDGNPNVFLNEAAGEIYVKRFNFSTGSMDFDVYTKAAPAAPAAYASVADLEEIRKELAALKKPRKKAEAEDE